jgi:hypothetical protein
VSSASPAWPGAALYLDQGDGQLEALGTSGRTRSVAGHAVSALDTATPLLFDRTGSVTIELLTDAMSLSDATPRQLAAGANRAMLGSEIIQFARALPLGAHLWQLSGLLRGRGGTELAIAGHAAGEPFVLLDNAPVMLDGAVIGQNPDAIIVAIGVGDSDPVTAGIGCRGLTQRPLFPVHPQVTTNPDGSLLLRWTRRARGAWAWRDGVETPLHEQTESYDVVVGLISAPIMQWTTPEPSIVISASQLAALRTSSGGAAVSVRQRGSYALSEPLLLTHIS